MRDSIRKPFFFTAFALFSSASTFAQIAQTFGPQEAPLGCNVYLSTQNAGSTPISHDPGGLTVYDSAGNLVFSQPSPGSITIEPSEAYNAVWEQVDSTGLAVAPGTYHLISPSGPRIEVGGAQAAVAPLGTRRFELCAPQDANRPFLMGAMIASSNPIGFNACGLSIPLPLQAFSLTLNDGAVFQGFVGFLDANGRANAQLSPPPNFLQLAEVDYAFVVFDFTQTCPLRRASARTTTLFL